jgi:hypothetical protein
MNATAIRKQVELALANRFGEILQPGEKRAAETLPIGIDELDNIVQGFPRAAISEIHGAHSSGRTSLLLSTLAVSTQREESCALVDCNDTFDLSSAAKAGIDFNRLLWIRCRAKVEHAFKACDLLLHGGGFGVVVLNLGDVPAKVVRRIITSWWFRFRRAIENTPTALIVITPAACVRSCAALVLELHHEASVWSRPLALVSENGNRAFTETNTLTPTRLSLVSAAARDNLTSTYSQFLHRLTVEVNTGRSLKFAGLTGRFDARLS